METKVLDCGQIISHSFPEPLLILEALNTSGQGVVYRGQRLSLSKNTRLAVYGDLAATRYLCSLWVKTSLTKGRYSWPPLAFRDDI